MNLPAIRAIHTFMRWRNVAPRAPPNAIHRVSAIRQSSGSRK